MKPVSPVHHFRMNIVYMYLFFLLNKKINLSLKNVTYIFESIRGWYVHLHVQVQHYFAFLLPKLTKITPKKLYWKEFTGNSKTNLGKRKLNFDRSSV